MSDRPLPHPPYDNIECMGNQLTAQRLSNDEAKRLLLDIQTEVVLLLEILDSEPEVDLWDLTQRMHSLARAQGVVDAHEHGPFIKRGESVVCVVCGVRLGWWCPDSPEHQCEYLDESDPAHDECIHCGQPEERK